jgi:hypothetical protein
MGVQKGKLVAHGRGAAATIRSFFAFASAAMAIAALAACASPQYDSQADTSISSLQKEIHSQIDAWISGTNPAYSDNVKFYNTVDTDLSSLEIRMEATPDPSSANLPTVFSNLKTELASMQSVHKKQSRLSSFYLHATQNLFDAQFAVLLTYELSLKTTGSGSTTSTATSQHPSTSSSQQASTNQ